MSKEIPKRPVRILAFNPSKKLVSIYSSLGVASQAYGVSKQSIHSACQGKCVSAAGMYFRALDSSVEVTADDLGSLGLLEYDELCGVTRKVFNDTRMTRHGMRYNKSDKNKVIAS